MSSTSIGKPSEATIADWRVSGISRKYPTYRKSFPISTQSWLLGKQRDDEAEGLWRIYDTLYDFSDFVDHHPGGSFWLKETRGTDITEAFETHHVSVLPQQIMPKYRVRQAARVRNYTLTMHDDGFYKTLKRRVLEKLKTIDARPRQRTQLMHLALLVATLAFTVASAATGWTLFELLAALALCWLAVAGHNFFHRRDNWQMYTFNMTLMNFHAWRISHALSHHAYANSLHDLEMSMFEPFLCWVPSVEYGTKLRRFALLFWQPLIYAALFPAQFLTRVLHSLLRSNVLHWHDVIGFLLPSIMFVVAEDATIAGVLRQWLFILALSGFLFGVIGLSAAHHHPQIYHDGDAQRSDRDWGLFQLDTIMDRADIKGSPFMVLTHFGEHALHHLFPTLDHGLLPQLYPEFRRTLQEFDVELRECNHLAHIIGQNKQLLRTRRNSNPPGNATNVIRLAAKSD